MKAFMVLCVCALVSAVSAGAIREKRGFLHGLGGSDLALAAAHSYSVPSIGYAAPALSLHAPSISYAEPAIAYSAPAIRYAAPAISYAAPTLHAAPSIGYIAPAHSYSPLYSAGISSYAHGW